MQQAVTADVIALLNAFCEVSCTFAPQFHPSFASCELGCWQTGPVCVSAAPFKHQAEAEGRLGPASTPGL